MLRTSIVLHKILFWAVIFIGSVSLRAQDLQLEVASFTLEENSLTAKNEPVYDNNNQKCALVIIKGMGDEKLRFNTGNSFIEVEEKKVAGERAYLMWIPEGVIKVTISSESQSFESTEYFFNPRVKKAETYLMNLKLEKSKSVIGKQFLEFVIEPSNATLEVNNELWPLADGIAYRQLPKGRYQFQIRAKDYHTEIGNIDFSDLSAKKTITISLKPNFGWLSISSPSVPDITLFIDDEPYNGPFNKIKLSSGRHTIKAAKELYQTFSQNINIDDNEETPLSIELKPNFSNVTINIANGGEIFIDNKLEGKDSWSGKLGIGNYRVELRKLNHSSVIKTISVKKIGENLNFDYPKLEPILGSVSIESNPVRAKVTIDGKEYGTTPILIPEIIIGNHNITLSLSDYKTKSTTFEVKEGEQTNLKYELEKSITPQKETPIRHNKMTVPEPIYANNTTKSKPHYGIIDLDKIISTLPEYNTLQQDLSRMQQKYETEFNRMKSAFQAKYDRYQKSPNERLLNEIKSESSALDTYIETKKKELEEYKTKEMTKIQQRVTNYVKQVSQEEKLVFVFSKEVAIYEGKDLVDITNKVINKIKK